MTLRPEVNSAGRVENGAVQPNAWLHGPPRDRPVRILLLIFIAIPLAEVWLLMQVWSAFGGWFTVGSVLLTAVIGVGLLRRQGFATLVRVQQRMAQGELPAREMVEAVVLAVSGALLLTPGFFTDALGFAGLVPGLRGWIAARVLSRVQVIGGAGFTADHSAKTGDTEALEGEFRREE